MALEGGDASRVMDDAAIARFIAHYERVTRHILEEMPPRADHLAMDANCAIDERRQACGRCARFLR